MSNNPLISIILPVYNQAEHVERVVTEYIDALSKESFRHELIVVPNKCRDRSVEICRDLALRFGTLKVVELKEGGWGRAVREGIQASSGDIISYTNLARTDVKELIELLHYAIRNPGHVIKANRKIRESWRRRLGSLIFNLECRMFFDLAFWDINGTPKVFPRSNAKLLSLSRTDDLIDLEFNVICRHAQYKMLEVPIWSYRRHGGKSTTNYKTAARLYLGAYQMWKEFKKGSRESR